MFDVKRIHVGRNMSLLQNPELLQLAAQSSQYNTEGGAGKRWAKTRVEPGCGTFALKKRRRARFEEAKFPPPENSTCFCQPPLPYRRKTADRCIQFGISGFYLYKEFSISPQHLTTSLCL
jgi:hypothetical protein